MRKVECKRVTYEYNGSIRNKREITIEGLFHQWGSDFEEFETGPGNMTVAIVELLAGTVETFVPSNIKFLN